jgi:hypothetical protein
MHSAALVPTIVAYHHPWVTEGAEEAFAAARRIVSYLWDKRDEAYSTMETDHRQVFTHALLELGELFDSDRADCVLCEGRTDGSTDNFGRCEATGLSCTWRTTFSSCLQADGSCWQVSIAAACCTRMRCGEFLDVEYVLRPLPLRVDLPAVRCSLSRVCAPAAGLPPSAESPLMVLMRHAHINIRPPLRSALRRRRLNIDTRANTGDTKAVNILCGTIKWSP